MKRYLPFLFLAACDVRVPKETPELSLHRMIDEPRVKAYQPSAAFDDGSGMRHPPEGTVPAAEDVDLPRKTGMQDGVWLARIPLPVTPALLARGRERFDIVCATCHGVLGNGESVVAEKMAFKRPPSLHEPRTKAYAPGQIYGIVRNGYGVMPGYAATLPEDDRWAVVAYLRALWLARGATVADLPPDLKREFAERAR